MEYYEGVPRKVLNKPHTDSQSIWCNKEKETLAVYNYILILYFFSLFVFIRFVIQQLKSDDGQVRGESTIRVQLGRHRNQTHNNNKKTKWETCGKYNADTGAAKAPKRNTATIFLKKKTLVG